MKPHKVFGVHLMVLAAATVATWWAFQRPQRPPTGGQLVLDISRAQLSKIAFEAPDHGSEATARPGGGFDLVVSEQKKRPAPPPTPSVDGGPVDGGMPDGAAADGGLAGTSPDAGTAAPDGGPAAVGAAEPAKAETVVNRYRASEDYERALERLFPLRAERDLGTPEHDKIVSFGLDRPERRLRFSTARANYVLELGSDSFGGASTYVRLSPGGRVLLVSSANLRALDVQGTRYLERRLTPLKERDVDRLVVTRGSLARELVHQDKGKPDAEAWVPGDRPDLRDERFRAWVGKFFRLSALEYLDDKDVPPSQSVARVLLQAGPEGRDGQEDIEIAKADVDNAAGKRDYFARSAFTGGWVKLERFGAEGVVNDMAGIVGDEGGEDKPAEPPPASPGSQPNPDAGAR
ncbi:MAG: DUF4340 domain-containing protein [Myxococcales bacterium]|nr:DUF4340 domain-containing protein [Myxococcales bacterium]